MKADIFHTQENAHSIEPTHIVIAYLAYVSQALSQFNNQIAVLTCESTKIIIYIPKI
jgi:hypothetical protein